jgi:hypothetical protein
MPRSTRKGAENMNHLTSLVVTVCLTVIPLLARAQQPLQDQAEAAAFRQLAAGIPLGSRIKVQTRSGARLTATLMTVDDDGIVVKRESRIPEPAVSVAFTELTRLQRDDRSGFTVAKAIGIGLAAGVGAILTMFAIAVSIDD